MEITDYENIVEHLASPTFVLAGPGSGKTFLLADRVKRLLEKGFKKETIMALAFGIEAKDHMIKKLIDPDDKFKLKTSELPPIMTMHSLGFQIISEDPHKVNLLKSDLKVQDDDSIKRLLYRDAALIINCTKEDSKKSIICKQNGECNINPKNAICNICIKYWQIMSKLNRVDFDDQILFACFILENNPDLLKKHQINTQHLLVDEYQDINAAQFKLIDLLSKQSRNGLFVVGDDAQSIYGFRGANPQYILNFSQNFKEAKTPLLSISRRVPKKIMEDAIKVLHIYYKDWKGNAPSEYTISEGEEASIWQLPSEIAEAEMVAKIAKHFTPKRSVLILVPKKGFFSLISRELYKYNIPHEMPLDLLPERIEIISHFIDWVKNPNDNFLTRLVIEDLINKGIAHVPGAKEDGRTKPETIAKRTTIEIEIAKLWESVDKHSNLYLEINKLDKPSKTLLTIKEALTKLLETFNNFKRGNKGEFIKHLSIITGLWIDPSRFAEDITSIVDVLKAQRPIGLGSVELKTMRKAKGLEADIVIMVGLEDDIVPNPYGNIEEEARLFYVSMTRAKDKLFLFHSFKRPRNISYGEEILDKPRSKFLDAIGRKSEWKK